MKVPSSINIYVLNIPNKDSWEKKIEGLARGRSYHQLCQIRIQTFSQKGTFIHALMINTAHLFQTFTIAKYKLKNTFIKKFAIQKYNS